MDDFTYRFGRHRIVGCPWHGLVRNDRLTLPNGQHIDGTFSANQARGSVRFAVPGAPAVSRTPEEVAADAAAGRQWRNDASIMLRSNTAVLHLYGAAQILGQALYAAGVGNCWAVRLPTSMGANAEKTQLLSPATLSQLGGVALGELTEQVQRSVTVTLSGYEADGPPSGMLLLDALPDGSQAILGQVLFDSAMELYVDPWEVVGFALMTVSGADTPEQPLAVHLAQLSGSREHASAAKEGGAPIPPSEYLFTRNISAPEWLDDPENTGDDAQCQMSHKRVLGADVSRIGPDGDLREALLNGYVIGHWFDAVAGTPVAVTLDMTYTRTVEYVFALDVEAVEPAILQQRYTWNPDNDACEPFGVVDELINATTMRYLWAGNSSAVTSEELELVLRAGGVVDTTVLRYEYEWSAEYENENDVLPPEGLTSTIPTVGNGMRDQVERLLLNGEVIDELVYPPVEVGVGIGPVKTLFDSGNLFPGAVVPEWLPGRFRRMYRLAEGRPEVVVGWQWLSNRLVCLREQVRASSSGPATHNRYGYTAHPSGVTAERIDSLAMDGSRILPLYGAVNPFDYSLTLGQLDKLSSI